MNLLYLVTESDYDAVFYALCAEKLTRISFEPVPLKNRKGDGVAAVKKQLRYALRGARAAAGGAEPVAFIAAIDNDRAPHPENAAPPPAGTGLDRARLNEKERERAGRLEWIEQVVVEVLSGNRNAWPLWVGLAVPVEMIESWIVRSRSEHPPQPTPHFSKADSERARIYYAPSAPPPQWKDLDAAVREQCGHADKLAFYEQVVREMDAEALAARSLSFRMFKEWLDVWPKGDASA